jgi:hypothetical protein
MCHTSLSLFEYERNFIGGIFCQPLYPEQEKIGNPLDAANLTGRYFPHSQGERAFLRGRHPYLQLLLRSQ